MSRDEAPALRPVLLVIGAMFAFSLMVVFTRAADANILGVAAWRAIVVALVFAASAAVREGGVGALRPDPTTLKLGTWLGIALAVASSTFVGAYALTTAANTIFLHNLAPVFVFPLAWWLFQERAGSAAVTGAVIALFGVALLSGVSLFQVSHFASSRFLLGDFLAFVSAVGYAAVLVLTRMTRTHDTPILGTLFVAWTVAAVALTAIAIAGNGFAVSATSFLWIVGLAIVSTNIPFYLLNLGMRHVAAGTAAVLSLSEVLFTTLIGIAVYGEHLAPIGWVGASLAGLGVLYAITQRGEVDGDEPMTEHPLLPQSVLRPRMYRALLGLVMLNAGAVATVSGAGAVAPIAALIGLGMLARHGPVVTVALLEGRFRSTLRWVGAALGLALTWTVYQWAGSLSTVASIPGSVLCIVVLVADRRLSELEPESDRDRMPLIAVALGLLGASMFLAQIEHGLASATLEAANLAVGAHGIGVLLSALAARSLTARPGVAAVERRPEAWMAGRRPAVAVGLVWALGCLHTVPTGHVGIIERFGAPIGQTGGAGLAVRFPAPIETVTVVDIGAEQHINIGEHTLMTGDQSLVTLQSVARFSIADPIAYAYGVSDPDQAVVGLARAALVDVVRGESQDALLTTGRAAVEAKVTARLQASADDAGLGIAMSGVNLIDVAVPPPVVAAFLDVITADEDRLERINSAEAYEADLIPRTRGEALARISNAEGEAARIDARAVGFDAWFRSVERNGRKNRRTTRARLAAEATEAALDGTRLIAAPADVRVWLNGKDYWPRDPNLSENP